MKKIHRLFSLAAATVLSAVAIAAFTGCDTNNPEITITYEFNGEEYAVDYILTRKGAPQTVRHFLELVDAGYYTDTVIHNCESNGTFLYGGGYTWNAEEEEPEKQLVERDYWSWVKNYEAENNFTFTQSVFALDKTPLYTVYGEFSNNGCVDNGKKYSHSYSLYPGALAMYYTEQGTDSTRVSVTRIDDVSNNDGESTQEGNYYTYNSATAMFYTFTGTGSRTELDKDYCVFGHVIDYAEIQELLDAITEYETTVLTGDEETFTESVTIENVNQYDLVDEVRNAKIPTTYEVPVEPIYIRSVKINKY